MKEKDDTLPDGTRVVLINEQPCSGQSPPLGAKGTVLLYSEPGEDYLVEFDQSFPGGHDGDGDGRDGHCWYVDPENLQIISSPSQGEAMKSVEGLVEALQRCGIIPTEKNAQDVEVVRSREVKQITLPDGMSLKEGAEWLLTKDRDEEKEVAISYELDCFPLDGAIAFFDAMQELYGFVNKVDTVKETSFGKNITPPTMIGVPVGRDGVRQVPWGRMQIPGIYGYFDTGLKGTTIKGMPVIDGTKFVISGKIKQRHAAEVEQLVAHARQRLQTHSIYKGQAIELDLSWMRGQGEFDPVSGAPKFSIPLEGVGEHSLVLPAEAARAIKVGLFTVIDQHAFCRRSGIPARRGVLLAGPPGTGKTLTAWVTAKKAVEQGMTFIYLKHVEDLAAAFEIARLYQPAVVFAEDLDSALEHMKDSDVEDIRNSFDGVNTKNDAIITVLTTNFIDKIAAVSQALLRQGRCDLLVNFPLPDAKAASELVRLYGGELLVEGFGFTEAGKALQGHIPAEIREAVERSKMACIERLADAGLADATASIRGQISVADVVHAVKAMEHQHELLKPRPQEEQSSKVRAAKTLASGLVEAATLLAHSENAYDTTNSLSD